MSPITQNVLLIDIHVAYDLLDQGMVEMFCNLQASALRKFLEGRKIIYKQTIPKFFQTAKVEEEVISSSIGGEFFRITANLFASSFDLPRQRITHFSEIT